MTIITAAAAPSPIRSLVAFETVAPRRAGRAFRTVATVYAICGLLALTYPQAIIGWLDDFDPNPFVRAAQTCTIWLAAGSRSLGVAQASEQVREAGKRITRKPD